MVIRAVVFDLDGLMFDTEALFYRVSCEALAARGEIVHDGDDAGDDRASGRRRGARLEDLGRA